LDWQARQRAMKQARGEAPEHVHVTRMWPRREAELLNGGSLYWVFKGFILARQKITRLDQITDPDGTKRCAIVLDNSVIRTTPAPRRPFQGWRYLVAKDAPGDLPQGAEDDDALPTTLEMALADIGLR
jgi:hypothetical protein